MRSDAAKPAEGLIQGATAHQRAIAIAGFLAEQSIQSMTVDGDASAGSSIALSARKADLPGLLCSRNSWVLKAPGLEIHGDSTLARWRAFDDSLADAIRSISAPR